MLQEFVSWASFGPFSMDLSAILAEMESSMKWFLDCVYSLSGSSGLDSSTCSLPPPIAPLVATQSPFGKITLSGGALPLFSSSRQNSASPTLTASGLTLHLLQEVVSNELSHPLSS